MEKDYKTGAIKYLEKLSQDETRYLYTKPFFIKPCDECSINFHNFANLINVLNLTGPTRVLDVGCGPGWMSEYLARLGHIVTGFDINPGMIEIAQKRVASIINKEELKVEFLVLDAEELDIHDTFDVAILYDSLHHFENKKVVLANVFNSLRDGGKLFIHEGAKPPKGSEGENFLQEVMEKYGTLEDPCEHSYLVNLLEETGYVDIKSFIPINGLFLRGRIPLKHLKDLISRSPSWNIILCRKPGAQIYDSTAPNILRAEIKIINSPEVCHPNEHFRIKVNVKNDGDTLWLSAPNDSGGFVTLGAKLYAEQGRLLSDTLPRTLLGRDVAPGESVELEMVLNAPSQSGKYTLGLDMVDEFITWFEERGSQMIKVDLYVKDID